MVAVELDKLTWPEVRAELQAGRETVVVAFGATSSMPITCLSPPTR